jgi:hypothetical protein
VLELNSPRWAELTHIYGPAQNIPDLLRQLPTAPIGERQEEAEPWHSLWGLLCDFGYGPVSTASYAAVPHIVAGAACRPPEERFEFISLVVSIESNRHDDAPLIPAGIEDDYTNALEHARFLIWEALKDRVNDEARVRLLLGGLAVTNGFTGYGNALQHLNRDGEVCHECGARVPIRGYWSAGNDGD